VVALAPSALSRRPGYRGTSRRWHAARGRLSLLALAFALGGCSFSYQLDSLFAKKTEADATGSLRPATPKAAAEPPAEGDLAIARAAVSEVLTKGGKDTSMPWENPSTGARGTITPLASAYDQDGTTCRDFLASYVKNGNESWLQGAACRAGRGKWEVRHLRPWKNT
jgi:17 kDa outer membrane surface antigen